MIYYKWIATLVKWYNGTMVRFNNKFDSYKWHHIDKKLGLLGSRIIDY